MVVTSLACSLPHPPALPPSVLGGRWHSPALFTNIPWKFLERQVAWSPTSGAFANARTGEKNHGGREIMGGKEPARNHYESTQLVPVLGHHTSKGSGQGFVLSADVRKRDGDFFSPFFSEIFPYFLGAASCEETKLYYIYFCFLYVCCILKRKNKEQKNGQMKKHNFLCSQHFFPFILFHFLYFDSLCSQANPQLALLV